MFRRLSWTWPAQWTWPPCPPSHPLIKNSNIHLIIHFKCSIRMLLNLRHNKPPITLNHLSPLPKSMNFTIPPSPTMPLRSNWSSATASCPGYASLNQLAVDWLTTNIQTPLHPIHLDQGGHPYHSNCMFKENLKLSVQMAKHRGRWPGRLG